MSFIILKDYLTDYKDKGEVTGKNLTLTWGEVTYLLDLNGYRHRFIDTFVPIGHISWPPRKKGFSGTEAKEKILLDHGKVIPYHFAYIKFYTTKEGYGPFALVAGKTNLGNPDFNFSLEITSTTKDGDLGRRFLLRTGGSWYCQGVLAVWKKGQKLKGRKDKDGIKVEEANPWSGPEVRRAEAVETKIRDLLELFSS